MAKLNCLNVGCGRKLHKDWVNIDMVAQDPSVIEHNLLQGMPFPDNQFDVLYHSQVLEHFPQEKAKEFMLECHRVLKPGGTLRVVVPDLEDLVNEYKKFLELNVQNGDEMSQANYDWILLEMFDQTVRNVTGGNMAKFLQKQTVVNENYVVDRIGYEGREIRKKFLDMNAAQGGASVSRFRQVASKIKSMLNIRRTLMQTLMTRKEKEWLATGQVRLGGEIHYWMYDRYSLSKLLKECGFTHISVKSPTDSDIPEWGKYELDVKEGQAFDPTSLFMEARKA